MKVLRRKFNSCRVETFVFAILLFAMFFGCAVPFETAQTLESGQGELLLGYSSIANLTFKGRFGITGNTDLGFGIDLPLVNTYLSAKQKLFSSGGNPSFDFFLSGAYGLVSDTDIPYYHCTLLAGISDKSGECVTFGLGILQDPRYTFNLFGSPLYSRETYCHALFGVSRDKVVTQFQIIYDPHDTREKFKISVGLGIRSIQFLE
ncbi:hypothetical protein JW879_00280 [candidate division WOR-3 bacterium]|nr:hypothetical protein [candidate division WOR-3 bacterium]